LRTDARPIFFNGIVAGLLVALLGALLGVAASKLLSPSGWGGLLYALQGLVFGYGIGAALGTFKTHRKHGGTRHFSRAFYSSMTALLMVVFLSEPFHLQVFPPLMWGILVLLPPFVATLMLFERIDN